MDFSQFTKTTTDQLPTITL